MGRVCAGGEVIRGNPIVPQNAILQHVDLKLFANFEKMFIGLKKICFSFPFFPNKMQNLQTYG